MQNQFILRLAAVALLALASGCANIREKHYFAMYSDQTATAPERLINIFQLDVEAKGFLSNVRYLAGNYDERAVDYFLNESKASDYNAAAQGDNGKLPGIWTIDCTGTADAAACQAEANKKRSVIPLAGDANPDGAFVIIISTNANAISETIGAIAENSATIKSLTYLMNQDVYDAQATIGATALQTASHRKLFLDALDAQMTGYAAAPDINDIRELGILKMLAAELDPGGPAAFDTLAEAKAWFAAVK